MTTERVWYEGIDGRWHEGQLDDNGGLTVRAGHAPAEGREVFHEPPNPDLLDGPDYCGECFG